MITCFHFLMSYLGKKHSLTSLHHLPFAGLWPISRVYQLESLSQSTTHIRAGSEWQPTIAGILYFMKSKKILGKTLCNWNFVFVELMVAETCLCMIYWQALSFWDTRNYMTKIGIRQSARSYPVRVVKGKPVLVTCLVIVLDVWEWL